MINFNELNYAAVFKNFERISRIPRGSGNEKEISDYLVQFAKKLNLEVIQDGALNVIIKKPASAGFFIQGQVLRLVLTPPLRQQNAGRHRDVQAFDVAGTVDGNAEIGAGNRRIGQTITFLA